jgi:hypothetical protein
MLAIALLFVALCICHRHRAIAVRPCAAGDQGERTGGSRRWHQTSGRRKMAATAISGAMAGAAGGLYVVVIRVAVPADVFGLHVSRRRMVVTLFGGVGTLWGPLIGAAVPDSARRWLARGARAHDPGVQSIVYGLRADPRESWFAPEGLYWYARDRIVAWRRKVPAPSRPDARGRRPAVVDGGGRRAQPAQPCGNEARPRLLDGKRAQQILSRDSKPCRM